MDVAVDEAVRTIETLAVHPDHQNHGIARNLLAHAITRARAQNLAAMTAWTRDDPVTLHWYHAMGFSESDHYLHVFANHSADPEEPARAVDSMRPDLQLMSAFLHAQLADESQLRHQFSRVHVCRCFTKVL